MERLPRNAGKDPAVKALRGKRKVFFDDYGYLETPIYERQHLRAAQAVEGPAIIEQFDSTTVLPPGAAGQVDDYGNIIIDIMES
jgi:N-methylhydantoinase A